MRQTAGPEFSRETGKHMFILTFRFYAAVAHRVSRSAPLPGSTLDSQQQSFDEHGLNKAREVIEQKKVVLDKIGSFQRLFELIQSGVEQPAT